MKESKSKMKQYLVALAVCLASAASADSTVGSDTYNTQPLLREATSVGTVNPATSTNCHSQAVTDSNSTASVGTANYTCGSITFPVTYTVAPPPAPTVSVTVNPTSVSPNGSSTLSWTSANATSCTASGGWSGAKATVGSEQSPTLTTDTTFNLACTGAGGTGNGSATVTVAGQTITGLNFPSNGTTSNDIRFKFTGANRLPMYPATYVWRVNLRSQSGYYTTFFWGPDGAFTGANYYGAHPYNTGKWEISVDGGDFTTGVGGVSTVVQYNVWKIQALRVYADASGNKQHEFYYDLPDTTKVIKTWTWPQYGSNPPSNYALTFGDAPWHIGAERLSGILRGMQFYSSLLTVADILSEVTSPLSTTAGAANVWYMNLNPTPTDISDKSGKGHNPAWVGANKATLWTSP